ncbi:hypothetical protein FGIG_05045 [Fasciola gigantica]|uniref:Uncharacterized protein n=1 Tax=Fasciola gigantica TaxID=46835 RepID=A0A504Y979_FASGI|nr:hypothetical protein FGIG_05045 [Fasciola gigantica]
MKLPKATKSSDLIKQHLRYNPDGIPQLDPSFRFLTEDYEQTPEDVTKLYHAARLVLRRDSNAEILSAQIQRLDPVFSEDTTRELDITSYGVYSTEYLSTDN